jgi:hypothetical protein
MAMTGDVLLHEPLWQAAATYGASSGRRYDFRPMFDRVRRVLGSADLALCHLETPVDLDNAALSSYPVFNVPWQIVPALRYAGYDACSTASNHSLDAGHEGIVETIRGLESAGLEHAGTGRSRTQARRPALIDVEGVKVAILSYTYGTNGIPFPPGLEGVVNLIDAERILRHARRTRRAGAEFVSVSLHWGLEYQTSPTEDQRTLARRLLRSPAVDLIVGHHAHVVQPIGRVKGKFVIYGLGNFLANQSLSCCIAATQDGVIVTAEVTESASGFEVRRIEYVPTWMELGRGVLTVSKSLSNANTSPDVRSALWESWRRTEASLTSLNAKAPRVVASRRPPKR